MARASKKKDAAPGNIEDTLDTLGIDKDLPPDAAAMEAVADGEKASPPAGDTPPPADDAPAEPPAEEKPTEDETPPAATTVEVEEVQPRLSVVSTDLSPPRKVPVPPPKAAAPKRATAPTRSPAAGKLGKGLSDKVPGAEKIKVYKRVDGQRWFIKDYTKDDLAGFSDMESFLTTYVKPKHGAGIYDLMGLDAHGRDIEVGIVRLIETGESTPQGAESGALSFAQQLIADQQKQNKEYLERMETLMTPAAQPNPVGQIKDLLEVTQSLGGDAKEAKAEAEREKREAAQRIEDERRQASQQQESAFAAMIQSMNSQAAQQQQAMLAMMQQQAQQQQQQTQLLVAAMAPKGPDPVMMAMLTKLTEDKSSASSAGVMPPPPPPPPDPMAGVATLITALAPLLGGGGGEAPPDDFKEFAKVALMKQLDGGGGAPAESDEFKELAKVILMKQVEGSNGTDSFKEATDHLAMLMNVANAMRQQTEGGAAAGFFDALAALFSNRDFAGSIANGIRAKAEKALPANPGGGGDATQQAMMQLQRQNQQLRQAVMQMQGQLQQGAPVAAGALDPAAGVPDAAVTPPAGAATENLTQDQVDAALAKQRTQLPPLPTATHEHLNGIAAAEDDADRVEKTVRMLIYFAEFEEWRPFSEQLLGVAASGDLDGTLERMGTFFKTLSGMGLVETDVGLEVLRSLRDNFEEIVKNLSDFFSVDQEDMTGGDLRGEDEDLSALTEDEDDGDEGDEG